MIRFQANVIMLKLSVMMTWMPMIPTAVSPPTGIITEWVLAVTKGGTRNLTQLEIIY